MGAVPVSCRNSAQQLQSLIPNHGRLEKAFNGGKESDRCAKEIHEAKKHMKQRNQSRYARRPGLKKEIKRKSKRHLH